MNEKQVTYAFFYLFVGIWVFLFFIYLETTDYNDFYFNVQRNLSSFIVLSLFSGFSVIWGLWKLRQNGITIRINKKTITNVKSILMIVGFALICIGIGLSSFFKPVFNYSNLSGFSWLAWHPFGLQGLVLFWSGTGIQFLDLVSYYDAVSKKNVKEARQNPSQNASQV